MWLARCSTPTRLAGKLELQRKASRKNLDIPYGVRRRSIEANHWEQPMRFTAKPKFHLSALVMVGRGQKHQHHVQQHQQLPKFFLSTTFRRANDPLSKTLFS